MKMISQITCTEAQTRGFETYGISLSRLSEICNAERDGRCVVLPCKVGDTVWAPVDCGDILKLCDDDYEHGTGAIECPFERQCKFQECDDENQQVIETQVKAFYHEMDEEPRIFLDYVNRDYTLDDFGKTVLLTRAAAEAALHKLDGGGQDARKGRAE